MKICSTENCGKKVSSLGYCSSHYASFKKYGDPLQVEKNKRNKYEENHKVIDNIEHKLCPDCKEWKQMEGHYHKCKNSKDGYNRYCKDCAIIRVQQFRIDNLEKVKEYDKFRYREKEEYYIEKAKRWNRENDDRKKEIYKEWVKNNPEKAKESRDYRYFVKNHKINKNEWENCKNYFNYRCAYCGLPNEEHFIQRRGEIKIGDFHKEHVDPYGINDLSNCVPACQSCNGTKSVTPFLTWYSSTNENFEEERLFKIIKWLQEDHKQYIEVKKERKPYTRKNNLENTSIIN